MSSSSDQVSSTAEASQPEADPSSSASSDPNEPSTTETTSALSTPRPAATASDPDAMVDADVPDNTQC
jgi:hypothetical protein